MPALQFEGIIFNMMNGKNPYELQLYDEAKKMFPEEAFFKTVIPYDDLFEQASTKAVPIAMVRGGKNAGAFLYGPGHGTQGKGTEARNGR